MQMYFIQSFFSHGKPAIYLRLFLLTFQKALFVCHGFGVKFNLCIVLSASGYVLYDHYKYFDQDERRLCGFLFLCKDVQAYSSILWLWINLWKIFDSLNEEWEWPPK